LAEPEHVAQHYAGSAFEFESIRLTELCPVEFAMTKRMLDRWILAGARVAEIGVGVGHYSEHLAARGSRIHLIDITQRLLDATAARLRNAGLEREVAGVSRLSATDLAGIDSSSFDAVMLFGPLYHLCALSERRRAVEEAARILKHGGFVYAAGINRLPYFRDQFRQRPRVVVERREFHQQLLKGGNVDPEHVPSLGFAHLTTATEFQSLFAGLFEEVVLLGVESFTAAWQPTLNGLPAEQVEAWLDLVEQTGTTPEGLGASDHFLFVGQKVG
jgi:SAM-dependent methyltransferase